MKNRSILLSIGLWAAVYSSHAYAKTEPAQVMPLDTAAQTVRDEVHNVGMARFTAPDFHPGTIRHVVMFQFKSQTTQAERDEVTKRFVALAKLSHRPDGHAVVASIETGPQISGENADLGLEQGYLVTFRSEGDRNFYVGRPLVTDKRYYDPAHDAFKAFAGPYLERAVVFDFPVKAGSTP